MLHRKARAGPETNPGPSCCEATALTTAPPCRPHLIYKLVDLYMYQYHVTAGYIQSNQSILCFVAGTNHDDVGLYYVM